MTALADAAAGLVLAGAVLAVLARRRMALATGFLLATIASPGIGRRFPPEVSWAFAAALLGVAALFAGALLWMGTRRRGARLDRAVRLPRLVWAGLVGTAFVFGTAAAPGLLNAAGASVHGTESLDWWLDPQRLAVGAAASLGAALVPLVLSSDALRVAVGAVFGAVGGWVAAVAIGTPVPDGLLPAVGALAIAALGAGAWVATQGAGPEAPADAAGALVATEGAGASTATATAGAVAGGSPVAAPESGSDSRRPG